MSPDAPPNASPRTRTGPPAFVAWTVKLVLTALVTLFIVRQVGVDLEALRNLDLSAWRFRPWALVGSVVALVLGYALSATLWGRMVRELGGPTVPARVSVPLFLVANLGRYIPGKVFQIAGLAWLARERGVRATVSVSAAVLGQLFALMGATVVGTAALLSPALDERVRVAGWVALGVTWGLVVLTSLPGPGRWLAHRLRNLIAWTARRQSAGDGSSAAPPSGTSVAQGSDPGGLADADLELPALERPGFGLRWTALYAMNWGLYATAFWLLFLGLVEFQPFLYVAPAFAAAYVGGYAALFAPAGLGVREGLLVAFLSPVMRPEPALALALAARLWATAVEVVPAAAMAPGVLREGES